MYYKINIYIKCIILKKVVFVEKFKNLAQCEKVVMKMYFVQIHKRLCNDFAP